MTNSIEKPVAPATEAVGRRLLARRVGAGAAVAALATGGMTVASAPAQAQSITDADIFNFALNLEYLEAEYYLRGVTGSGLAAGDTGGTGASGGVTGGSAVNFRSDYLRQYMTKIAIDEQAHVKFIRAVLGSSAVARPAIDFATAFTTLARAAGLINGSQTFNPFADEVSFLLGAFVFEDVGVTAYGGAASLISNRDFVSYAASVLAVEAYHAGAVRTLIANIGGGAAANSVTALRAQLSGAADEVGVTTATSMYNFAPTDSQAQTFRRSPRQVLNIVYGAQNASSGLFFPAGMNGTIRS
ncbi:ferritin-like domain-containing protein [Pararoseomonas indoligenes]|uniref:Ferritin-like domain-containing protein n=1 Tax=Roseomonas indoligenes TaxID=2820811 RepID=A0A940MX08_9PROT|nr:ferritin-like domain-containing protein [Pararoseomonas indoligenes]MBP0494959.1 ferritin-like domain-containing protein [Pararoseomonas indoligenes]